MNDEIKRQELVDLKDVVVLYHKNCVDGFTGAWVAHKKFGEGASYVAVSRGEGLPLGLEGKEVYVVDFSFSKEDIVRAEEIMKRFVILDHHISSKEDVESAKEHVFTTEYSGAYLAYQYFFPEKEVPLFIRYVSEGDTFLRRLPNDELYTPYVYAVPYEFTEYDKLENLFSTEEGLKKLEDLSHAVHLCEDKVFEPLLNSIHFVELEGVVMPAINATLPIHLRSIALHKIYTQFPPVALSYRFDEGDWKCSLRSNGDFDCTIIAGKFGGGGHKGSAGFAIKGDIGLPFAKMLSEEELPESFKEILAKDKEK